MDYGPSCLVMIAKHYGTHPNIEAIRKTCDLGKGGVSLLGISKAAEEIGFKTIGGRLSFDTLTSEVPLPCIIHWNQNHFVVVYKIKKRRGNRYEVYVADPGKGLITYTKEEFCEHWVSTKTNGEEKGIALLLEPTEKFYVQNDTETIPTQNRVKFLWKYLRKYRRFFIQLILGLLLGSLLQLVFPFLTQAIVDTGIGGKDIGFVWLVLLAQMMLLFSRTAIDFIRSKILLHISTRINISLISDFFIKLMKLPMKFFDTKLMGDLLQRIEDHRRVEQFLTSSSLSLLFSFFTFLVFGIVLAVYYSLSSYLGHRFTQSGLSSSSKSAGSSTINILSRQGETVTLPTSSSMECRKSSCRAVNSANVGNGRTYKPTCSRSICNP